MADRSPGAALAPTLVAVGIAACVDTLPRAPRPHVWIRVHVVSIAPPRWGGDSSRFAIELVIVVTGFMVAFLIRHFVVLLVITAVLFALAYAVDRRVARIGREPVLVSGAAVVNGNRTIVLDQHAEVRL
ncbi:hypothetical protein [Tsukamurella soli]|uniref:Uncharacterized protein n=1 Tax=Tsukamurella soli TaxID=644556 RepID=A0ABP8JAP0_9ACTN